MVSFALLCIPVKSFVLRASHLPGKGPSPPPATGKGTFTPSRPKERFMSLSRILAAYNAWSSRSPLVSQTIVATVTTAAADAIIQQPTSFDDLNFRRTVGFGVFGFAYVGLAQYAIYVYGYQKVFCSKIINRFCEAPWKDKFRDREGIRMLGKQMGLDFFVVQPVVFWPSYYWSSSPCSLCFV